MTTFDNREKAFEDKFAHDANLTFLVQARCNKRLGAWAAGQLDLQGAAIDDYVKAVLDAARASGDKDAVFAKIRSDFKAKALAVSDADIKDAIMRFTARAADEIERGE